MHLSDSKFTVGEQIFENDNDESLLELYKILIARNKRVFDLDGPSYPLTDMIQDGASLNDPDKDEYIVVLRKLGTHLIPFDNIKPLVSILNTWPNTELFLINQDGIHSLTT